MSMTAMAAIFGFAATHGRQHLAIGVAGTTSWEKFCLGLPTPMPVLGKNQQNVVSLLTNSNATLSLNSGIASKTASSVRSER
jgi:spore coat polysaccharide biosynthesis predicted glycosyltransferase SpsG